MNLKVIAQEKTEISHERSPIGQFTLPESILGLPTSLYRTAQSCSPANGIPFVTIQQGRTSRL